MMEPTYNYIADLSQHLPDIPPDSVLSRSIYTGDDVKATLFGFSAGQELTEHTASYPAIIHFLQGEAELTLGNDRMEARAGTWAHMPARLPHSIRAKTPVVMLLVLISNQQ